MTQVETVTSEACSVSYEDFVDRARAIAPRLRERALQADKERCTPAATVDDYRQTGLIRCLFDQPSPQLLLEGGGEFFAV